MKQIKCSHRSNSKPYPVKRTGSHKAKGAGMTHGQGSKKHK